MTLFGKIVNSVLKEAKGEEADIIPYNSIKSDYVKGPMYVFHMTSSKNLHGGILKTGWERFFNDVNSYGPGIYTCVLPSFDPKARVTSSGYGSKPNPKLDASRTYIYGSKDNSGKGGKNSAVILLCKTLKPYPLRSFLIFDENIAKLVYKNHWHINDQLRLILGEKDYHQIMASNKELRTLAAYADSADRFLKNHDKKDSQSVDAYNSLYYRGIGATIADRACNSLQVNKKIRGLIFHGPGDGFVAIFRDYNALQPIGVSTDLGHTFKPLATEEEFEDYKANNIDIGSALGLDRFYNAKNNMVRRQYQNKGEIPFDYLDDTFYGDYAIVGKNINGKMKWNYLYKPLIERESDYYDMLVSKNIWFDSVAKNDWLNNQTIVSKNGEMYFIRNDNGQFFLLDKNENTIGNLNTLTDNDLNTEKQDINNTSSNNSADYSDDEFDFTF